jgi:hypothetical protein
MRSLMSVYVATFAFRLVNASQIVRRGEKDLSKVSPQLFQLPLWLLGTTLVLIMASGEKLLEPGVRLKTVKPKNRSVQPVEYWSPRLLVVAASLGAPMAAPPSDQPLVATILRHDIAAEGGLEQFGAAQGTLMEWDLYPEGRGSLSNLSRCPASRRRGSLPRKRR